MERGTHVGIDLKLSPNDMMDLRNEVEPVVRRSDRVSKRLALLIAARFFLDASKFAYV